ncbi:MAG: MFS transporter [Actinobacteria bacterium]|nr:MFS transporter [Actinomycetota bacterium]
MQRRFLMALTLVSSTQRLSLAAVPPVTTLIAAETGLDAFRIGMATTITVVVMGIGSPLSAQITHLISRERIMALGALLVVVGCAVRAVPPLWVTLYVGSVVGGLGIAMVGTMVPGVIAERLPHTIGLAVGATTFSLTLGAVVVSSLTAPIAGAVGAPLAMAVWAVPAMVGLLVWLPFTRRSERTPGGRTRLPWNSGSAWLSVALMSGQSTTFVIVLAWVAPSLQQAGMTLEVAGLMLGAVTLGNMTGAMISPLLSQGGGDRRRVLLVTLALTVAGALYLAIGTTSGALPMMLMLGLGIGGGFGVVLSLLIDLGSSPRATAGLSAMTFLIAYLASAPGAALSGAIRDVTGGFAPVWFVVVAVSLAQIPIALALGPRRFGTVRIAGIAPDPTPALPRG